MRQRKSLRRAAPKRAPKAKFIIYSEGKNTEPDYFRAVRRDLLGALVDLEVIDAAGVPITIAEKACERATAMKRAADEDHHLRKLIRFGQYLIAMSTQKFPKRLKNAVHRP